MSRQGGCGEGLRRARSMPQGIAGLLLHMSQTHTRDVTCSCAAMESAQASIAGQFRWSPYRPPAARKNARPVAGQCERAVAPAKLRCSRGCSWRRRPATPWVSLGKARNRFATRDGNMLSSSPSVLTLNSQTGRSGSGSAFWPANVCAAGSHGRRVWRCRGRLPHTSILAGHPRLSTPRSRRRAAVADRRFGRRRPALNRDRSRRRRERLGGCHGPIVGRRKASEQRPSSRPGRGVRHK